MKRIVKLHGNFQSSHFPRPVVQHSPGYISEILIQKIRGVRQLNTQKLDVRSVSLFRDQKAISRPWENHANASHASEEENRRKSGSRLPRRLKKLRADGAVLRDTGFLRVPWFPVGSAPEQ